MSYSHMIDLAFEVESKYSNANEAIEKDRKNVCNALLERVNNIIADSDDPEFLECFGVLNTISIQSADYEHLREFISMIAPSDSDFFHFDKYDKEDFEDVRTLLQVAEECHGKTPSRDSKMISLIIRAKKDLEQLQKDVAQ